MFHCPAHASYVPSLGVCRCDSGWFRVKGQNECAPLVRMLTSTVPPSLPLIDEESEDDVVIYSIVVCVAIGSIVVGLILLVMVGVRRYRQSLPPIEFRHERALESGLGSASSIGVLCDSEAVESEKDLPDDILITTKDDEEVQDLIDRLIYSM